MKIKQKLKEYNINPIIQLVEHCNQYNHLVYCVDLLSNLDDDNLYNLFYTEEFEILPQYLEEYAYFIRRFK